MRRLLPILLLAALCWPAAASASPRQTVTFEAPRELLSASTRDATLDQITGFGVTHVRQLVYWRDYAPDAGQQDQAGASTPSDPNAYPADKWDNLDGLVAAAEARGVAVTLTLTGPVPKWATRAKRDNLTDPDAKEFGAFATAIGRRYGDAVSTWSIWNEPNQPQFLKPQYKQRQAGLAEALPQALPGGLRRAALDARQRARTRS